VYHLTDLYPGAKRLKEKMPAVDTLELEYVGTARLTVSAEAWQCDASDSFKIGRGRAQFRSVLACMDPDSSTQPHTQN
jgi:hypothetical protein